MGVIALTCMGGASITISSSSMTTTTGAALEAACMAAAFASTSSRDNASAALSMLLSYLRSASSAFSASKPRVCRVAISSGLIVIAMAMSETGAAVRVVFQS